MGLIILKTSDQQNSNTHNSFLKQKITKFSPLSHNCLLKLSLFIKKKLRKQSPTLKNLLNVSNQPNLTSFVYHATDVIFLI